MTEEPNKWGRPARHPIVVRCQHGIQGGAADFVQRYRYDVSMGRWNPTDRTAEGATWVGASGAVGDQPPLFYEDDEREHFNARCKECRRVVPMGADRAQSALTQLSDAGLNDISLAGLQHAYDNA